MPMKVRVFEFVDPHTCELSSKAKADEARIARESKKKIKIKKVRKER